MPVLAFAALHWALLALSHLVGLGAGGWPALANIAGPALGATLLGWLLTRAIRAERWESP